MTYDDFKALITANRTYRRFDASRAVGRGQLLQLVDLARMCASGRNLQPLRYRLVTEAAELDAVFETLKWAGYYTDWDGPSQQERPTAYMVQCLDTDLTANPLCDEGLQLEAITLGACTMGLGNCIVKSFSPEHISRSLNLPANLKPVYVLALGYPAEEVRLVDLSDSEASSTEAYKYYRDSDGVHTVPKRTTEQLVV